MKTIKIPDIFALRAGDKVKDTFTGEEGVITSIRETAPEWIEAFVTWQGETKETVLNPYRTELICQ